MNFLNIYRWLLRKAVFCGIGCANFYFYLGRRIRSIFSMTSTDRPKNPLDIDHFKTTDTFTNSLQCRLETLDAVENTPWTNGSDSSEQEDLNESYFENGHNDSFLTTLDSSFSDDSHDENQLNHAVQLELPDLVTTQNLDESVIRETLDEILQETFALCETKLADAISEEKSEEEEDLDDSENSDFNNESNTDLLDVIPRVRRCSSLKTGKTPPGTPCRKKIVRFADVLGLDLADVRTYLDEIPKIPVSAYNDLDADCDTVEPATVVNPRTLLALFQQPNANGNFLNKVAINMVMLETAYLDDPIAFCIKGTIRVRNLDFNKTVHVRYTLNSWLTSTDIEAQYVENSSDGFTDKFTFILYAYTLTIGQKLEFAVRYQCKGEQFWDNNDGANYRFQCLPPSKIQLDDCFVADFDQQLASFYYLDEEKIRQDNVQDYLLKSLEKNSTTSNVVAHIRKPELLMFFIVLFFSIIFLYVRKLLVY